MIKKKSQGEIFGIALMFVIIIIGIIVYAQIKKLNPDNAGDELQEGKYKILSEGTLNTVVKLSTGCYVERGKDTVQDLINYCLENSFSGNNPRFRCSPTNQVYACDESIDILNDTISELFNNKLGGIPYLLLIDTPANPTSRLHNKTITNFGSIQTPDGNIITEDNYRRLGYKRAPSGLKTWSTAQRNINFELYLYYK